jgi:hypothetical protein
MASPGKKSYPLRVDPALWAEIERLAAQELRSANAQVEFLLREALARRGRLPVESVGPAGVGGRGAGQARRPAGEPDQPDQGEEQDR